MRIAHARGLIATVAILALLGAATSARSTTITVENIGSLGITGLAVSFDIAPFPAVCSDFDYTLFSLSDSRDSGLFRVPFDDAHPLLPGQHRTSFRIPTLTGVDFNYIGGSLGSFGRASIAESRGCAPIHVSIHPPTEIDLSASGFPLAARFTFRPGGQPPPEPVPEPTTLLLVGTTAVGLGLARWRRRKRQP